ncbi:MAG: V-type ATP synthase subunit E [Treponema sp.]|jgi:V/A-type H+-transporting ATPase subunit E|nr:V-type ATP synthase subunit E [Treponema sp.]
MEIQVQELIDKIKKDGIETASQEAHRMKSEAQAEARRIVETAKKEADDITLRGKQDAERSEKAAVAALEQASRNLVLAFKDEIQALLNKIVSEKVNASYNDDILKAILPDLIKSWAAKGSDDLSIILAESELPKLQAFFNDKLAGELKGGIELKSTRRFSTGFHISNKEGSVYYDFSAEAVSQLLSTYLNSKLAETLKNSVKGM